MIISIIIPLYYAEAYIPSCLDSCYRQGLSIQEYEIVVINDGSLDNSLSIVKSYAQQYDNIHLVNKSQSGPGGARNSGMQVAQGDYLLFLDADDRIQENSLKSLIKALENEHPDCMAFCAANMVKGKPIRRNSYKGVSAMTGLELLKRGVEPCATFTLWKTSFLREHQIWFQNGIFHEDCEFTPRAYYFAQKVIFSDDIVYFVYPNPQSITRSVNPQKSFDLVNVVCRKLSEFVHEVTPESRYLFHNLISLYLNNAMANIIVSSEDDQRRLNETISSSRYLWQNLKKSSIIKYQVEGYLFSVFYRQPLKVYKFLQLFNRK